MESRKTNNSIYIVCILLAVITFLSMTLSLALMQGELNKPAEPIEFENVSLCGDGNGSKLSFVIDRTIYNGGTLFSEVYDENVYLSVKPTNETADCFIKFKIYITLGSEKLDQQYASILESLNNDKYLYKGFEINNDPSNDYGFIKYDGYYHLIEEPTGRCNTLKRVTKEDNVREFILCKKYAINFDPAIEDALIEIGKNYTFKLVVQVEAQQADGEGVSNRLPIIFVEPPPPPEEEEGEW